MLLAAALAALRAARLTGAPVLSGGLVLTLPECTENGAQVPLALRVEPPAGVGVHSLYVIATANPAPEVLDLEIRDPALLPEIQTRIRIRLAAPARATPSRSAFSSSARWTADAGGTDPPLPTRCSPTSASSLTGARSRTWVLSR